MAFSKMHLFSKVRLSFKTIEIFAQALNQFYTLSKNHVDGRVEYVGIRKSKLIFNCTKIVIYFAYIIAKKFDNVKSMLKFPTLESKFGAVNQTRH